MDHHHTSQLRSGGEGRGGGLHIRDGNIQSADLGRVKLVRRSRVLVKIKHVMRTLLLSEDNLYRKLKRQEDSFLFL